MSTRTTSVGTLTSSDFLTAAEYNDAAGGWIGHVANTSGVTGLTGSGSSLSLSVTVTVGTSRRIWVYTETRWSTATAQDDAICSVQESGTDISQGVVYMSRTGTSSNIYKLVTSVVLTPSAGSHTYSCVGGKAAGTGPVAMEASSTHPAFILVVDLGPA